MPRAKRDAPAAAAKAEPAVKKTKEVKENADSLKGKPPVRPAPWKAPIGEEAMTEMILGKTVPWSTQDNRNVVLFGSDIKMDCPPALVTESFLGGLGRSPHGETANSHKNKYEVKLQFGNLPQSVKDKNPNLEFEHREFMTAMKEFVDRVHRLMYDSGEYNKKGKEDAVDNISTMQRNLRPGWPKNESLLTKEVLTEILQKSYNIEEKEALSMIESSGLLVPGGARPEHDAEIRERVTEVCVKEEKEAFEKEVHNYAFKQWVSSARSPIYTDPAFPERMSMKFDKGVMFQYKDASRERERTAREIVSPPELQEYMDFLGPWGSHTSFGVTYYSPPGENRSQARLFQKELEDNPILDIVKPGDLISLKWHFRTYSPNAVGGVCGIKSEPDFGNVFIHHQGNPEETAHLVPKAASSGYDYGTAPEDYSAFR